MPAKLSDAELDSWLAEKVMGWEKRPHTKPCGETLLGWFVPSYNKAPFIFDKVWNPTQDRNQLQLCLEKVGEMCLQEKIAENLSSKLNPIGLWGRQSDDEICIYWDGVFDILAASPRAIAEAIYLTLEGE